MQCLQWAAEYWLEPLGMQRVYIINRNNIFSSHSLQKIQQLSEGSMFGHGLKHLFHSRRRSREREHQNSQDSLPPHYGLSDHESPDEKERSPEMHRVSYAVSLHDLPARPTAFNRVLQQIRSRPSIKRGTSLHSGSRRAKSGSLDPQKGSPHLIRKAPQDSSLTAILHQHQGRPRSSSTTDTAILLAESGAVYLLTEDSESLADKVWILWGGGGHRAIELGVDLLLVQWVCREQIPPCCCWGLCPLWGWRRQGCAESQAWS
uniref:Uncharacterized protein n=1 Tax=Coturnix japonica TaxID=93934 RepID=A0A8C2YDF1_COTJA